MVRHNEHSLSCILANQHPRKGMVSFANIWHILALRISVPVATLEIEQVALLGKEHMEDAPIVVKNRQAMFLLADSVVFESRHIFQFRPTFLEPAQSVNCAEIWRDEDYVWQWLRFPKPCTNGLGIMPSAFMKWCIPITNIKPDLVLDLLSQPLHSLVPWAMKIIKFLELLIVRILFLDYTKRVVCALVVPDQIDLHRPFHGLFPPFLIFYNSTFNTLGQY